MERGHGAARIGESRAEDRPARAGPGLTAHGPRPPRADLRGPRIGPTVQLGGGRPGPGSRLTVQLRPRSPRGRAAEGLDLMARPSRAEDRADGPARRGGRPEGLDLMATAHGSRPTSGRSSRAGAAVQLGGRRAHGAGRSLGGRPGPQPALQGRVRAADVRAEGQRRRPDGAAVGPPRGLDLMARPSMATAHGPARRRPPRAGLKVRAAEGLDLMARPSRAEDRRAGPARGAQGRAHWPRSPRAGPRPGPGRGSAAGSPRGRRADLMATAHGSRLTAHGPASAAVTSGPGRRGPRIRAEAGRRRAGLTAQKRLGPGRRPSGRV